MPTSLTELFSPACHLCPRRCGAARDEGARGVCGANDTLKVARAALHMWEEPPISGEAGSGTIFFSGCSLKCVYCQNHEISTGNFGLEISPERLVDIMLELQDQGANNINLVTATHYAHLLPAAIAAARARGLVIPIVYNTSGYERASAVAALGDLVDVWLTDFKYADAGLAQSLSHIKDYPRVAVSGLAQMAREIERRGGELVDEDGYLTQEDLDGLVALAEENKMQVAVHAIGDKAIEMCLDSYAKVLKDGKNPNRHGIVHCQITDQALLRRFRTLDVLAFVQPIFIDYDMNICQSRIGEALTSTSYAWRNLYENGVHVSFGTDCPVEKFDTMPNLYSAVTRQNVSGEGKRAFLPQEAMTMEQALKCYTIEGAYASGEEHLKGSITPGKLADFVVCDEALNRKAVYLSGVLLEP